MSEARRCGQCGRKGHNRRTCPGVTARPAGPDTITAELQIVDERPVEARSDVQEALAEAVEAGRVTVARPAANRLQGASDVLLGPLGEQVLGGPVERAVCPGRPDCRNTRWEWSGDARVCGECKGLHPDDADPPEAGPPPLRQTQDGRLVPAGDVVPPWATTLEDRAPIRITMPGVYQLRAEEYHADPVVGESLSNSGAKLILPPGAPAIYRDHKDNAVKAYKDVYDFGHIMHEIVLGDGGGIAVIKADNWRTKKARDERDAARAAGQAPILEKDLPEAEAMAAAFLRHEFATALLRQPGKSEQTLVWSDKTTGQTERAMLDFLPDPVPLDSDKRMLIPEYKTRENVCPDHRMSRDMYEYGYHRQGAKYRKGVLALGLAPEAIVVFLFQAKTRPFLVTPVFCDRNFLIIGNEENRRVMETYAECMESGVWPAYSDQPVEISAPVYIERQYEDLLR